MSEGTRNPLARPGVPSPFEELCLGRVPWGLVDPFPEEDAARRERGDAVAAELDRLLEAHLDPDGLETSGRFPRDLLETLRSRRLLDPSAGRDLGGLGLSHVETFRLVTAAATRAVPVGLVMAVESAIGLTAYLPALAPGPLRELVRERIARGAVSGTADTEPAGAANTRRMTTAEPVDGGAAFVLRGRKVFIGNAPVAELVVVTATVREAEGEVTRLFFVDADSPGLELGPYHEYMGIRGFPNGPVTLNGVRVPRERVLFETPEERLTPSLNQALIRGRLFLIAAPALAIARRCLAWSRDFVGRRSVDGRALGTYDEVQRMLAGSLADTFALETVAEWCLLAEDRDRPVNVLLDQVAAKNIASGLCWRVVERTLSLLAAEGYETAASKARRGAPAEPLERAFRDARGLRISGGVDFQLDNWAGRLLVFSYYYPLSEDAAAGEPAPGHGPEEAPDGAAAALSPRNRRHLAGVRREARALARRCRDFARRHPDRRELLDRERVPILASRIVNELLSATLVLSRAGRLALHGHGRAQVLADVFCAGALRGVAELGRRWDETSEPDAAALTDAWLRDGSPDPLGARREVEP